MTWSGTQALQAASRGATRLSRAVGIGAGSDGTHVAWSRGRRPDLLVVALCAIPPLLAANGLISQVTRDAEPVRETYGAIKDVILGVLTVRLIVSGRWRQLPRPLIWLVGVYLALGILSMYWSTSAYVAAYGFRNDFLPALWILVACDAFRDQRLRRLFAISCVATAGVASLVLISTWSRGIPWLVTLGILPPPEGMPVNASFFNSGSTTPRGFSPWVAPNVAGVSLTVMLAVALLVLSHRAWAKYVAAVPVVAAVYLTGSRSSILGLAAMLGLVVIRLAWVRWGTRLTLGVAVAVLAVGTAGFWAYFFRTGRMSEDPSLVGHADSLDRGLHLLALHPWGVGVGDAGPRSLTTASQGILLESSWFLLAVEATVLALAAFMLLQAFVLVRCLPRLRDPHSFVGPAVIVASLASQFALPMIQEGAFSHLFWMALGLSLAAAVPRHSLLKSPQATAGRWNGRRSSRR